MNYVKERHKLSSYDNLDDNRVSGYSVWKPTVSSVLSKV